MSHELRIFGSGNNLLETEGDVSAEFKMPIRESCWVAVSDGTILNVTTPDSFELGWGMAVAVRGKSDITLDDDGKNDFAELVSEEPFLWVMFGSELWMGGEHVETG